MRFIENKLVTNLVAENYGWSGSNYNPSVHQEPFLSDGEKLYVDVFTMSADDFNKLALISRSKGEAGTLVTGSVEIITDGFALYFDQGSMIDGDSQEVLFWLMNGDWDKISRMQTGDFINMY